MEIDPTTERQRAAIAKAIQIYLPDAFFADRKLVEGTPIDPEGSKDADDAIHWQKDGPYEIVTRSMADTSVIEKGDPIDQEAFERGSTRYFRTRSDPLLPRILSEDRLSLLQGRRPTVSIITTLESRDLTVVDTRFELTYLADIHRLNYEEADMVLKNPQSPQHEMLRGAYSLARRLYRDRLAHGAIGVLDFSSRLTTNEEGQVVILEPRLAFNAHLLIQEMAILAHQETAKHFVESNIPGIFRNHQARAIAPDRGNILARIQSTSGDEEGRLNTLRGYLSMVMERAYYSPTLEGHYALNKPAYTHLSPLRRYIGIVNMRQLVAGIRGEQYPHSFEELVEIAEHINALEIARKDAEKEDYKRKDRERSRRMVNKNQFDYTSAPDFSKIIEVAVADYKVNSDLEREILQRLKADALGVNDVYLLLFVSAESYQPLDRIRRDVLVWLKDHAPLAIQILHSTQQALGYSIPDVKVVRDEPAHLSNAMVSIQIGEQRFDSDPVHGPKNRVAAQLASVNLLAKVSGLSPGEITRLGLDSISLSQAASEFISVPKTPKPATDFKGDLGRIAQAAQIAMPSYLTTSSGEAAPAPRFTSVAKFFINGQEFVSDPQAASSKKTAELLAAQNLLDQINASGGLDQIPAKEIKKPAELVKKEPLDQNYKGKLLQIGQQRQWDETRFIASPVSVEGVLQYSVVVRVTIGGEIFTSDPVTDPNKKYAEQLAAASLLARLPKPQTKEAFAEIAGTNFIGNIQEYAQKYHIKHPRYAAGINAGQRISTCIITSVSGETIIGEGEGPNDKIAKHRAAKAAWEKLQAGLKD